MKFYLCVVLWLSLLLAQADSLTLKVYFLYGSKTKKEFKATERKSFGGILGGHVGLGVGMDSVLNFLPSNGFHLFSHKKVKKSRFYIHNEEGFWSVLGGVCNQVKGLVIEIPINEDQRVELYQLMRAYLNETPYDYAFIGMRCGASTYEILAQLGFLKEYSKTVTACKIFYPRLLRNRLIARAEEYSWKVTKMEGSKRRKWEK